MKDVYDGYFSCIDETNKENYRLYRLNVIRLANLNGSSIGQVVSINATGKRFLEIVLDLNHPQSSASENI